MSIPYSGEILSLICAIIWATAVILFRKSGESTEPLSLNLFKNSVCSALFLFTFLVMHRTLLLPAPIKDYLLLIISGIIGVVIADTLFFKSLNLLGAGLLAIVDCLYTPIVIGLTFFFLGERLSYTQLLGALMIISAILISSLRLPNHSIPRKNLILGILLGSLSIALMAVSIVMIKPLLNRAPILWVTMIRLVVAAIVMSIIALFHPRRKELFSAFRPSKNWKYMLPGAILGNYFAMFTWMGGIKFTYASIAAAINQTSVIFVLIFAAIFLKEKFTLRKFIGMIMAFSGVVMVTLG
ncbi:MAG: DMT family transporter [Candidatus Cloacimonadota bacterium]|nr:DMT family transporter [Candidatus Cloacimonadota bacterium]